MPSLTLALDRTSPEKEDVNRMGKAKKWESITLLDMRCPLPPIVGRPASVAPHLNK
jgi:hypothetical protein